MSRTVINNVDTLKFLHKAKPNYKKAILKAADKELVHCICECVHNTLIGKVPLTKSQKSKLSKHKSILRRLVKSKQSLGKRKNIIIQKGGAFLPVILGSVISGLLGSLFNKS